MRRLILLCVCSLLGLMSRGACPAGAAEREAPALAPRWILRGHRTEVAAVAWHPDGRKLASADWQLPTIRLWDLSAGQQTELILAPGDLCLSLFWSMRGLLAVLSDASHHASGVVWNATTQKTVAQLEQFNSYNVSWDLQGRTLVGYVDGSFASGA